MAADQISLMAPHAEASLGPAGRQTIPALNDAANSRVYDDTHGPSDSLWERFLYNLRRALSMPHA
jgi:hypothetical protein